RARVAARLRQVARGARDGDPREPARARCVGRARGGPERAPADRGRGARADGFARGEGGAVTLNYPDLRATVEYGGAPVTADRNYDIVPHFVAREFFCFELRHAGITIARSESAKALSRFAFD